jgi:hypothetical protein
MMSFLFCAVLVLAQSAENTCGNDSLALSIVTTVLDAAIEQIYYLESHRVLIITAARSLYVSNDDGVTWSAINIPRASVIDRTRPSINVRYVSLAPSDKSALLVVADNSEQMYWVSNDAARTFELVENVPRVQYPHFHATFANVLIGSQWANHCVYTCRNESVGAHPNVLMSFDTGRSWVLVAEYATPSFESVAVNGVGTASLFFLEDPTKERNWANCEQFGGCLLMRVEFDATGVQFLTVRSLTGGGVVAVSSVQWSGSLWVDVDVPSVIFAARRDTVRDVTSLSVSVDGGDSFRECAFHGLVKPQRGNATDSVWQYAPLVADDTALVVAVHDPDRPSMRGDVYVADSARPYEFFQRLRDVKQISFAQMAARTDFEQLQGIDGVFFANRFVNDTCVQSVLSIDMGVTWSPINAGSLCGHATSESCSLHFFGVTAQFGAVYSAAAAVAVWLAQVIAMCM